MKPELYRLIVKGIPVVQQRPRKGKWGNFYDPSKNERDALSLALTYARLTAKMPIIEGPLHLYVYFYGCGGRCDLSYTTDKIIEMGVGVLWKSKDIITQIHASKSKHEEAHIEMEIVPL